jgi:hypothetical protein
VEMDTEQALRGIGDAGCDPDYLARSDSCDPLSGSPAFTVREAAAARGRSCCAPCNR